MMSLVKLLCRCTSGTSAIALFLIQKHTVGPVATSVVPPFPVIFEFVLVSKKDSNSAQLQNQFSDATLEKL